MTTSNKMFEEGSGDSDEVFRVYICYKFIGFWNMDKSAL